MLRIIQPDAHLHSVALATPLEYILHLRAVIMNRGRKHTGDATPRAKLYQVVPCTETVSRHTLNIAMFLTLTPARQPHYSPPYVTTGIPFRVEGQGHALAFNRNRASRPQILGRRKSRDREPTLSCEWPYTNRRHSDGETRTEDSAHTSSPAVCSSGRTPSPLPLRRVPTTFMMTI